MLAIPTENAAHDPPARVLDPADVPDLSDPATGGAAIGILRAWSGDPTVHTKAEFFYGHGWLWAVRGASFTRWQPTPTEAEAIVAAAEALASGGGR